MDKFVLVSYEKYQKLSKTPLRDQTENPIKPPPGKRLLDEDESPLKKTHKVVNIPLKDQTDKRIKPPPGKRLLDEDEPALKKKRKVVKTPFTWVSF